MARFLARLSLLGGCLAAGFAAALFFPVLSQALRAGCQRLWSRAVLASLGVRLEIEGEPVPGLLAANHVSWLDVLAIAATRPAAFVCKQEIAAWPGLGWLLGKVGTVFMRRGSARAAWRAVKAIGPRLAAGDTLGAFPEATTTMGDSVLPFFPALFQAAVDARAAVQPVALLYLGPDGERRYEPAYEGETSFAESLFAVSRSIDLRVLVVFLPAFSCDNVPRREAARRAHALVSSRIRHAAVAVPSCEVPILRPA